MVEPVDVVLPPKRSYYVIFNARSGTAASLGLSADALRTELEQAGHMACDLSPQNWTVLKWSFPR